MPDDKSKRKPTTTISGPLPTIGGGRNVPAREEKRGKISRGVGFLLSGEEFIGGITGGKVSTKSLPMPARFLIDTLASPIGLAALAAAPFTGGGSLAARGALGTAQVVGKAAAADLAISATAVGAGRLAQEALPEDAPGILQVAAPLLVGLGSGVGVAAALNASGRSARAAARAAYETELQIKAAGSGYKLAQPLGDFEAYKAEAAAGNITGTGVVATAARQTISKTGINPSAEWRHPVEHSLLATTRMKETIEGAVVQALPTAFPKGPANAFVRNIDEGGIYKGTGKHYHDVLADPDAATKYGFTPEMAEFQSNYVAVVSDVRELRRANGLLGSTKRVREMMDSPFTEDGRFYIPRQVKGAKGLEFHRESKPELQRVWESATDAALTGEVNYDDPLNTLRFYLRRTYSDIADKEFADDLMEYTVTPKAAMLADKTGNAAAGHMVTANKAYLVVKAETKALRR